MSADPIDLSVGRVACRYCSIIREHEPTYRVRAAVHAVKSSHPRCDLHWRFECAVCGKAKHFHGIAFCAREEKLVCLDCARETRAVWRRFWAWRYFYRIRCPWHPESHDALDRLEHDGKHPWQIRPAWRRAKRGMTRSEELPYPWVMGTVPLKSVGDARIRKGWDDVATWWISRYSPKGDVNREWVIDPVLLRWLGDVHGLRVLDAGCGVGYLSRILARRGARVDGVDVSPKLLAFAVTEEKRRPLGIRYRRGDLANLAGYSSKAFDAVVSNVVIQDIRRYRVAVREIHRVLKPGGRFLFSTTHPAFEAPVPGRWAREPIDTERIEDRRFLAVDRYFDRVGTTWGPRGLPPAISFHRPLRDYFDALTRAGLLVRRLEEPYPSKRALKAHYRTFADLTRIPLFLIIEAVKPRGST